MAFADTLLAAFQTAGGLKEMLGAALNRCEIGGCVAKKNLSLGLVCVQCGKFCCNAHGFVPLSAVPAMLQTKRPLVVCSDCLVLRAETEARTP